MPCYFGQQQLSIKAGALTGYLGGELSKHAYLPGLNHVLELSILPSLVKKGRRSVAPPVLIFVVYLCAAGEPVGFVAVGEFFNEQLDVSIHDDWQVVGRYTDAVIGDT